MGNLLTVASTIYIVVAILVMYHLKCPTDPPLRS